MGLYDDAIEELETGIDLIAIGRYRQAIFHFCLSVEQFLKSKLLLIAPLSDLEFSHDVINIYNELRYTYKSTKNMASQIKLCRKYFNESRYSNSNRDIYTKEFAEQFLQYANDVKSYIDNECAATLDDLVDKFNKH
ncbi:hypothetical protein AGMMS49975_20660 [Clostridia bacterium]|nr:hypothetical protein AGMMS49975_20660 [Clostridia bacterium]